MSVESMAIALHHSRASGVARLVLLGIANHDGDGGAWPCLETLAIYAGGVSTRSVRRALGELEELGEISREVNAGHGYRPDRRPNLYRFLLTCPQECDRTSRHRARSIGAGQAGRTQTSSRPETTTGPVDNTDGRTRASSRGVERADAGVRHGRTQVSAKPSVEPSLVAVDSQGEVTSAREAVDNADHDGDAVDGDETHFRAAVAHRPERGESAPGLSGLCPTHRGRSDAPPCRTCRDHRIRDEETEARDVRAGRAATTTAAACEQRQLQWNLTHAAHPLLVGCPRCDENGYHRRSGRPCDHDPMKAMTQRLSSEDSEFIDTLPAGMSTTWCITPVGSAADLNEGGAS